MSEVTNKATSDLAGVWSDLIEWVRREGGQVHSALALQPISGNNRGVFADRDISKGEILISLPDHLSLDGRKYPDSYTKAANENDNNIHTNMHNNQRTASAWLRCLAAYYNMLKEGSSSDSGYKYYLASLPTKYETLWQWSTDEIRQNLAGTSSNSIEDWRRDAEPTRSRYTDQIRPFLVACNLLPSPAERSDAQTGNKESSSADLEFEQFAIACQCLSTRAFHLSNIGISAGKDAEQQYEYTAAVGDRNQSTRSYDGPFLLPIIDLLNHSSNVNRCSTTLQRLKLSSESYNFVMFAERDIAAGEEVVHSYGSSLTATQWLQTFGFVPIESMARMLDKSMDCFSGAESLSPAFLSSRAIFETAWGMIESNTPEKIVQAMEAEGIEDEVWTIKVDRSISALQDTLPVYADNPLSNELVATACLPFLPPCARAEVTDGIDESALFDYYLGKLVCMCLLQTIQKKRKEYTAIPCPDENEMSLKDDRDLLRHLIASHEIHITETQRIMYGLTIRLEERTCLDALLSRVMSILAELDQDEEMSDDASDEDGLKRKSTSTGVDASTVDKKKRI
jgi:SET domain